MTRHTPELMRARLSNLSLRTVALEQSYHAHADAAAQSPLIVKGGIDARDIDPAAFTKPYVNFMTENPTIFHAVDYFKGQLAKAGYKEVRRQAPACN